MNYLEILNITADATEAEIKKAYFNKVREFPPEKFPDEFKRIREAYEYIQQEENKESLIYISQLPLTIANIVRNVLELKDREQYSDAIAYINNELENHPDEKELLIQLGNLYVLNNQIGKAVDVFRSLVEGYPNDPKVLASAAMAY